MKTLHTNWIIGDVYYARILIRNKHQKQPKETQQ